MNTEASDIYSDISQSLGLGPSRGGTRLLQHLFIWVGVVVLTTFIVLKWSTGNPNRRPASTQITVEKTNDIARFHGNLFQLRSLQRPYRDGKEATCL
jgi:hypothetical protein